MGLRKGDDKMGVLLAVHDNIWDKIEVRRVEKTGAIPAWNDFRFPLHVIAGDWIVGLDGKECEASTTFSALRDKWLSHEPVRITICTSEFVECNPGFELTKRLLD